MTALLHAIINELASGQVAVHPCCSGTVEFLQLGNLRKAGSLRTQKVAATLALRHKLLSMKQCC
jgi:hypothetical protein